MGHRAHQFALDCQQLLQVLGHAIKGRRQAPHRVGTPGRHTHLEVAFGDARGGGFQASEPALKLTHQ